MLSAVDQQYRRITFSQSQHSVKAIMGSYKLPIDSWKAVDAGLNDLLSGKEAGLLEVCAAVQHLAPLQPPKDAVASSLACSHKVMKLLAMLLAARRRSRDWKQQGFSGRVTAALAAATAVLHCPLIQPNHIAAKISTQLLADTKVLVLVAAAQREVTQLLSPPTQQLRQQPGDQHHKQQQLLQQCLSLQR